ncbi:hypothetical protein GCM10027579_01340 [Calidifontibacter terrae]
MIPAFNAGAVIGAQLDALLAQRTQLRWEIVVADNGSTDETARIVRSRSTDHDVSIRLVDASRHRSPCTARNVGATATLAPLLLFCDADDVVGPGWLEAGAKALGRHDVVGGRNRQLTEPFETDSVVLNPQGLLVGSTGRAVLGCNFGVRRDMFFSVGGFDEGLPSYGMDDVDFSRRVAASGGRIGFAPDMVVYFRVTRGTRTILRKTYLSGLAEFVVWHRYPEVFAQRSAPRRLALDVAGFFPTYAAKVVRGERPAIRPALRDGLTRVAHLHGHLRWIRTGTLPAAVLIGSAAESAQSVDDLGGDGVPREIGGPTDTPSGQIGS